MVIDFVRTQIDALLDSLSNDSLSDLIRDVLVLLQSAGSSVDDEFLSQFLEHTKNRFPSHPMLMKYKIDDKSLMVQDLPSVSTERVRKQDPVLFHSDDHLSDFTEVERRLWLQQSQVKPEEGESFFNCSSFVVKGSHKEPKFYNTIKMGVLWTAYNKTHFDKERPPPPQVIGYKFNIFYPELIDASKTPSYRIEKAVDSNPKSYPPSRWERSLEIPDEHVSLVFSGGSPYADISFQIVNREWDVNPKTGFRCLFERGVLHLWFNFKSDYKK